ncbi:DNA primase [Labedella populi]|uniref:DNA primase n=1 Tax=Labedella populi TaxID=2498850 RepID=A0A3S3ZRH5_9MICO|nr:DNA primase [Labedella populi]RWZ61275.1 DNA primase [Labedella populi]
MAGRIRQSDIDEVKSRTNIADIIGDHVSLKSAGVGSLKGLCPFHDERSPSFHVRPQVGFYHCFGCGESGDVISFLRKIDHVTFTEAVERLAGRIGFTLTYEDGAGPDTTDGPNRARLLAANQAAEQWFQEQLHTAAAEPGRRFLGERGFDADAAARFGVGFAPQSWDQLTKMLTGRGFTRDEINASGLVSVSDRGAYDRFRGRLVWPIRDVTGQTVGFGARRLLNDDKGPKYLNTPETPVYHKAQVLYGLDLAKREISRGHRVVVVEGYTDVMAAHLAGVGTAVATCGTSFGVDHIKVLRRVMGDDSSGGEVIFTFDPDAAGQKAALRAFSEEKRFAAQTYVAIGRDGLDPCDLRLAHGDDAVRGLIDAKEPMFEFVIRQTLSGFDLDTVEGRVAALRKAAPVVADIRDPSIRPGYTRVLAGRLGMDLDDVARAVTSASRRSSTAPDTRAPLDVVPVAERAASLRDLPADPATRLERDALMAIVQHPDLVGRDLIDSAILARVDNPTLALVRDALAASMEVFGTPEWFLRVGEALPEPFRPFVRQLAVAPIPQRDGERLSAYVRGITISLIERDLLQREAELRRMIQRSDPNDRDASRELQRRLVAVGEERRRLQSGAA